MATRKQLAMEAFNKRLTDNQRELVREQLLHEALAEAETAINRNGKYKVMPHWSYCAAYHTDPNAAIYSAVFWAHAKLGHLWKVNEEGQTVMLPHGEL